MFEMRQETRMFSFVHLGQMRITGIPVQIEVRIKPEKDAPRKFVHELKDGDLCYGNFQITATGELLENVEFTCVEP